MSVYVPGDGAGLDRTFPLVGDGVHVPIVTGQSYRYPDNPERISDGPRRRRKNTEPRTSSGRSRVSDVD